MRKEGRPSTRVNICQRKRISRSKWMASGNIKSRNVAEQSRLCVPHYTHVRPQSTQSCRGDSHLGLGFWRELREFLYKHSHSAFRNGCHFWRRRCHLGKASAERYTALCESSWKRGKGKARRGERHKQIHAEARMLFKEIRHHCFSGSFAAASKQDPGL